jgi:hypothetical protein
MKEIAVITKSRSRFRQSEFVRTSLGYLLEGHKMRLYIIDIEFRRDKFIEDNLEWILEAGGKAYSNNPKNVDGKIEEKSLEEIARDILQADIIVPF